SYGITPVPNPDVIQEFKIQTSGFDAGYGRGAGANVNVVTKSGTNDLHGSGFEFLRNSALNANDFFLNRAGRAKGVLNQNQFGGTVGGPSNIDTPATYQGAQVQSNLEYLLSSQPALSLSAFNSYAPAPLPFRVGGVGSATTTPGFVSRVLYHTTCGLIKFTCVLTPAIVNEV